MTTINLRDFYPWITHDEYVDVTEEMLEAMKAADRQQEAYRRRTSRYKAYYSFDVGFGDDWGWLDSQILDKPLTPEEIYEHERKMEQLHAAIGRLTEVQQRRIKAYYFEGLNFRQIGEREGVNHATVSCSVKAALKKLKDFGG